MNGTCNEDIATSCVNNWLIGNSSQYQANQCMQQDAGCVTNFDMMTQSEKQAMADRFDTRVGNLEEAYQNISDRFQRDVANAMVAHQQREDAMR